MNKISKNENGFSAVEVVLIVVILALIGVVGWLVYNNHHKATIAPVSTTTTTTKSATSEPAAPSKSVNQYAGWQSYTLQYDKLTFKYPANWTVKTTSSNNATDFIQFSTPDSFNFSIQDGEGSLGGDGVKIISTQPVSFAGQSVYIAYLGDFPQNDPTQTKVVSASVVSDPASMWSRPTDKNAVANNGMGGHSISILMSYNSATNKTLTAQTVQSDPEYINSKLVVESMSY